MFRPCCHQRGCFCVRRTVRRTRFLLGFHCGPMGRSAETIVPSTVYMKPFKRITGVLRPLRMSALMVFLGAPMVRLPCRRPLERSGPRSKKRRLFLDKQNKKRYSYSNLREGRALHEEQRLHVHDDAQDCPQPSVRSGPGSHARTVLSG